MIDLDELRRLALGATPGPWHFHQDDGTALDISEVCIPRPEEDVDLSIASLLDDRDGAFIAAANPQVILELIERLRETERLRAHWREKCTDALIKRDAALARIAEATKVRAELWESGAISINGDIALCKALGLNEGENDE